MDIPRSLQQTDNTNNNGNNSSMLFLLYFCLLICCCVTPLLYYLRLYLFQRLRVQRLRELEHESLMAILQQTMNQQQQQQNSNENRMMRQERTARIQQMMEPVRKVLYKAVATRKRMNVSLFSHTILFHLPELGIW